MFERNADFLGILISIGLATPSSVLASFPWPGIIETCTPLELVGDRGSSITKTVTIPSLGFTRTNWNTDWSIPSNRQFKRFEATIISEKNNSYKIEMYLKYSDGTASQFYDTDEVQIMANTPLIIEATPRPKEQPYQVNLSIGGLKATGQTYTAEVVGCY